MLVVTINGSRTIFVSILFVHSLLAFMIHFNKLYILSNIIFSIPMSNTDCLNQTSAEKYSRMTSTIILVGISVVLLKVFCYLMHWRSSNTGRSLYSL